MRSFLALLILAFAAPALAADLTLDRIFGSPALSGPSPRKARLSPDGRMVTLLRPRDSDRERYDLWAIDGHGSARMLVDSAKIGSGADVSEAEKMRRERARIAGLKGIVDYAWPPDGRSLLVPLDGDLYLASLAGAVRRLTHTPATEIDPHVSERGRYVSFVRDQNVYLIDLASGAERGLTRDGGGTLSWGTAEFVNQEEFDRATGQWWSPDDRYIALQRTDESKVREVARTSIGVSGTSVYQQRYPVAGSPNAAVELWILPLMAAGA